MNNIRMVFYFNEAINEYYIAHFTINIACAIVHWPYFLLISWFFVTKQHKIIIWPFDTSKSYRDTGESATQSRFMTKIKLYIKIVFCRALHHVFPQSFTPRIPIIKSIQSCTIIKLLFLILTESILQGNSLKNFLSTEVLLLFIIYLNWHFLNI